jgi:glycosyltransferase involved in cell wall biosynthesis
VHVITTIMRGGAENQLIEVVKEQAKAGHDVEIIYLKGEPELADEFSKVGASLNSAISNRKIGVQFLLLRRLLWNQSFTIHAHLPRAEILCALTVGKSRLFFTRHNSEPFFPGAPKFICILLSRIVCNRSIAGIAITNAVRNYAISSKEISSKYPLRVIHYGYTPTCKTSGYVEKKSTNVSNLSQSLRVVTVGRLVKQKDQKTLITSVAELRKSGKDVVLTIIGDGPLRSDLQQLSDRLGVSSYVEFSGRIQNPIDQLRKADVFILPSIYEGFGLVLLEAMDCGLPIIAADNTCIPEVLGGAGVLFRTGDTVDLASKILGLFDWELRATYSKRSILRLTEFNPRKMSDALLGVYRLGLE